MFFSNNDLASKKTFKDISKYVINESHTDSMKSIANQGSLDNSFINKIKRENRLIVYTSHHLYGLAKLYINKWSRQKEVFDLINSEININNYNTISKEKFVPTIFSGIGFHKYYTQGSFKLKYSLFKI